MVVYLVAGCFLGWMVQLLFDHVFIRRPMKFSATRLRQLRNRLKDYEEETATLYEQIGSANSALKNTTQDVESLNRQIAQYSTNQSKLESSLNSLQIKYASKEVDLMHANEQIEGLHIKLKQRPAITSDSSQEALLAAYSEEHQLELEARSAELRAANTRIKSLEAQLENLTNELDASHGNFNTTSEGYDAKISDMRDQIDAKSIALKVANDRIGVLTDSLEAVRLNLKAQEADIEGSPTDMKNTIDGLRLLVANQDQMLLSAKADLDEFKQQIETTNASVTGLEAELELRPNVSAEQIDEMRELAHTHESELAEAAEKIEELEAALQKAHDNIDTNALMREALVAKERTLATAQKQMGVLEADSVKQNQTQVLALGKPPAGILNSGISYAEGVPPEHANDTLYYQISSLHADLMAMQREMKTLRQDVASRDEQIATLSHSPNHLLNEPDTVTLSVPVSNNNHQKNNSQDRRDDLTDITGIGGVYSNKFYKAGIYTFAQLAELNDEQIIFIIQPKRWQSIDTAAWTTQAAELSVRQGAHRNE